MIHKQSETPKPLVNRVTMLQHPSIMVRKLAKLVDEKIKATGWSNKDWNGKWGGRRTIDPF